ncbi:MAG: TIGR03862 family flavoprotein [Hydrogenophaga sp.]|uniref:TIGR03862 family flavoprotein n=1 Tax=Hydrogenophaga sp. TaxID=1904254 RepID=UPI002AB87DF8|nr:TIGR03862 family flavoprotein [Hydrogenophaga sp.]MDZ4100359.1 TIGR03862 family flavoprotein [Hydrogenophaga sp.]
MSDFNAMPSLNVDVAIIGGGPAGLMAAEVLSRAGLAVHLFDAMPSVGRKFLLAGKGGLNLTHAEPLEAFVTRYGAAQDRVQPLLQRWGPEALRDWATGLGIETFVGTSNRVFPTDMKSAPLLRAWLHRLRHPGEGGVPVVFHMRHRWKGWDDGALGPLVFDAPSGRVQVQARATVLALGGASWARLGSDGAWLPWLEAAGVAVGPLLPSNCGFDVAGSAAHGVSQGWSTHFSERFAGQPFKSVAIRATDSLGQQFHRKGEFVATVTGVEGSLIYAASSLLRDEIARNGHASFEIDLLPDRSAEHVLAQVSHPRGSRSLSSHLKSRLGLDGIKMGILHERLDKDALNDPVRLAQAIKALPITVSAARPIDEAISSAGGVRWEALNPDLMVEAKPGLFCAGEMLDWEAPTGGYLLTACMASGVVAGEGVARHLRQTAPV